jgi:hypothetical protein
MKNALITSAAGAFILFASLLYAQSEQTGAPISQPLISEGTFALKLATSLKLGSPKTEAEAEDILAAAGISPRNGWMADYPLTPVIIGQVEQATLSVAGTDKLPLSKEDAQKAFEDVIVGYELAVAPAAGQFSSQLEHNSEVPPEALNNYYSDQGPPVVTYYPPPWSYSSLYSYFPYPFYGYGSYYPGFYMMNDFAFSQNGRFGRHFISNHRFNGRLGISQISPNISPVSPNSRFATGSIFRNRGFVTGSNSNTRIITGSNGFSYFGRFGNPGFIGNGSISRGFGFNSGRPGSFGFAGNPGGFRSGGFGGLHGGGGRSGGFRGGSNGGFHGGGGGFHGGGFGGGHR